MAATPMRSPFGWSVNDLHQKSLKEREFKDSFYFMIPYNSGENEYHVLK